MKRKRMKNEGGVENEIYQSYRIKGKENRSEDNEKSEKERKEMAVTRSNTKKE